MFAYTHLKLSYGNQALSALTTKQKRKYHIYITIHREDHDNLSLIYRFDACRFERYLAILLALLLHNTVLASIDTFFVLNP